MLHVGDGDLASGMALRLARVLLAVLEYMWCMLDLTLLAPDMRRAYTARFWDFETDLYIGSVIYFRQGQPTPIAVSLLMMNRVCYPLLDQLSDNPAILILSELLHSRPLDIIGNLHGSRSVSERTVHTIAHYY
jgi:hypothetical protein